MNPHRLFPQPLIIRTGKHPHELWVLYTSVVSSIYSLLFGTPSQSIDQVLPVYQRLLWNSVLLLGGAIALAGIYWKTFDPGLRIERIGLGLLGLGGVVWAIVLLQFFKYDLKLGGLTLAYILGLSVAHFERMHHITQDLRKFRDALGNGKPPRSTTVIAEEPNGE